MDTADWAQEAEAFLQEYHQSLLDETIDIPARYFPEWKLEDVAQLVDSNPVLKNLELRNYQANPFELFETVRGWKPVLRRLPVIQDARIVTLARRDLCSSLQASDDNVFLVSRQHWALVECLRHAQGLYQDETVRKVLKQDFQKTGTTSTSATSNESKFRIATSEDGTEGRYVVLEANEASPGDVLFQAEPFVASPYDFAPHAACFHCAQDISSMANTATTTTGASLSSAVRDLSLQCSTCQVSSLAYCSVSCRQIHQTRHSHECSWIQPLARKCQESSNRMAPFKVLLVLRAALTANDRPKDFRKLLELEAHTEQHNTQQPEYAKLARDFSQWMVDEVLNESEWTAVLTDSQYYDHPIDALVHIFLSIPINAMSLGPSAVGLFPGMPSMFNHSCLENVTHSWDANNRLVFRAVEALTKGDECCISYVTDLHLPTAERTQALQVHKFFTCHCPRCSCQDKNDEQGRLAAIQEWKQVAEALETEEEAEGHSTTIISLFRRRIELAETLFPTYFVTKGLVMEELAHALMDSTTGSNTDHQTSEEAIEWLQKGKAQYETCRGPSSEFVQRVDQALDEMAEIKTGDTSEPQSGEVVEVDEEDVDADLIFHEGWETVVLEFKLYEAMDDVGLHVLAERIQRKTTSPAVQWAPGHRAYEIGYGIRSMILSCQLDHSAQAREDLVDLLEETFDDDVQHVDILTNTTTQ
jgi:translation elongation factor EF-1beta